MKPLVLIPFASEVHGREYYVGILEVFRAYFKKYGIEFHSGVVTREDDVELISKKYSNFIPIALVLTGGTSRLIYEFALRSRLDRMFVFSHSEHNSLASAISARSRLEYEGVSVGLYNCTDPYSKECEYIVDRAMNVARTVANVVGTSIGVVADRKREEIAEVFESKFDATVNLIPFSDLEKEIEEVDSNAVDEAINEIKNRIGSSDADDGVKNIARLYVALKNIVKKRKLDAITIDCFPYILRYGVTPCIPLALLNSEAIIAGCEADLTALLGLMIARYLTGKSGWIANPVSFSSRRALFAHCTVALDIVRDPSIVPHFETGRPYSVSGKMISDTVTLLSVDQEFSIATIARGRVVSSGLLGHPTCRNQVLVEFDYVTEEIPRYAPTNHHVIMLGDHLTNLIDVGYMLGIDVVEYRELMK
ncbi:MAG: hypothetical protein N3D82_00105 [Ignisphaera sp.]|nr:hypothetical protein [Ignisphaera sp.]MCX8167419.1 hypothetical protein [Ignisphaera sp.]MDW8085925.1 hypothetical protein [Ignisphaera sp.]